MSIVYSLEEARSWFLHNTLGSVTCHRADGNNRVCWSYPEAEEFYGGKLEEKLAEAYGLGACCGTCMYWQSTSRNTPASQTVRAMCKRFPPSGQSNLWPETLGKDWCGEYSYCVYSSYAAQPWPEK